MKKLVIADRLSPIVAQVYNDYTAFSGVQIAMAAIMSFIQLYCDFSGGIDIALGVAQILGIEMDENFRRPLFSQSLAEYWRRWHITLGTWMKDYVFYSLSFSKPFLKMSAFLKKHCDRQIAKTVPAALAYIIVFCLVGIWHGPGWFNVVFGLYNAIIIATSVLLESTFAKMLKNMHIQTESLLWRAFRTARTLCIVVTGNFIFSVKSVSKAIAMLQHGLYNFMPSELSKIIFTSMGLNRINIFMIFIAVLLLFFVEYLQEKRGSIRETLDQKALPVRWAAYLVLIFFVLLCVAQVGSGGFMYAQY